MEKMDYCMHCMKPHAGSGPCPHCGQEPSAPQAGHVLRPGTLLNGRYLLGRSIGQGGFGVTYIGRDLTLDLRVAVKEFFPFGHAVREADGSIVPVEQGEANLVRTGMQRFLSEARTLARFTAESGVVNVRDCFEANGTAYLVMEYLEGTDLRNVLAQRRFPADEIFIKMAPLMDALEKIHAQGVIHRDISPDNIMLLPDGSLRLMDFGAARMEAAGDERSRNVSLKRGYAPPEQYALSGEDGPWTDIYALCATIYKCITGITPEDSLLRTKEDPIRWPSQMGLNIRRAQENVLKKGLEPDAADRFRSIGELKRWLSASADDDITVYVPKVPAKKEAPAGDMAPPADRPELPENAPAARPGPGEHTPVQRPELKTKTPETGSPARKEPTTEERSVSGGSAGDKGPRADIRPVRENAPLPRFVRIGALVLCALIVIGAAAALLPRFLPASAPAPETQADGMRWFTLTAQDMSVADYQSGTETLRQRLNILAGEEGYTLSEQNGALRLGVREEVFGSYDPEYVLKCYVTRPIEIYLINSTDGAGWDPDKVALSRADLDSVVLRQGNAPGAEEGACEQHIELTLTQEAAARVQAALSSWERISYAQDVDQNTYMYSDCIPAGDGRTFYLVNTDIGDRYHQTLLYNLTHEPTAAAFGVQMDLVAVWEDPAGADVRGENQVRAEEITGEYVTAFYTTYTDSMTAGEQLDTLIALKARLDSVGVPYAFGRPSGDERGVAVRIGTERMGRALLQSLGQSSPFMLRTDLSYGSAYSASYAVEDGALRFTPAEYQAEDTAAMIGGALNGGQAQIRLCVSYMPVMSATLTEVPADGSIRFDTLSALGGAAAFEQPWFAEMVCAWVESDLPHNYYLQQHRFSGENVSFGLNYDQAHAAFTEAVHSVCPGVQVHFSEDESTAYVHLALNVDETMAPEAARLAKEIYEAVSFVQTDFSTLVIYMTDDEDNVLKERARIFFNRSSGTIGSGSAGRVCASGMLINGRMERYKDAFRALVETDEFYLSLADPQGVYSWRFDE